MGNRYFIEPICLEGRDFYKNNSTENARFISKSSEVRGKFHEILEIETERINVNLERAGITIRERSDK